MLAFVTVNNKNQCDRCACYFDRRWICTKATAHALPCYCYSFNTICVCLTSTCAHVLEVNVKTWFLHEKEKYFFFILVYALPMPNDFFFHVVYLCANIRKKKRAFCWHCGVLVRVWKCRHIHTLHPHSTRCPTVFVLVLTEIIYFRCSFLKVTGRESTNFFQMPV